MACDSQTTTAPSSITGMRPWGFRARNAGSSSRPKLPPAGTCSNSIPSSPTSHRTFCTLKELRRPQILIMCVLRGGQGSAAAVDYACSRPNRLNRSERRIPTPRRRPVRSADLVKQFYDAVVTAQVAFELRPSRCSRCTAPRAGSPDDSSSALQKSKPPSAADVSRTAIRSAPQRIGPMTRAAYIERYVHRRHRIRDDDHRSRPLSARSAGQR